MNYNLSMTTQAFLILLFGLYSLLVPQNVLAGTANPDWRISFLDTAKDYPCTLSAKVMYTDSVITATPASQVICSGNAITTIVLSGNVPGTTYKWTRDNVSGATGISGSGSGNISGSLTNTTNAPAKVTFIITPTIDGLDGKPISATVVVNPLPRAFMVTGGGQFCVSSNNIGLRIGLSGSQPGFSYQLRRNGTAVGNSFVAKGIPVSFPLQTVVGTYTVVASDRNGCSAVMNGSAVISAINCDVLSIANPSPCSCLNNGTAPENGQFGETIVVTAPADQTWKVKEVKGLFNNSSPAPPAEPVPITVGTILSASGRVYTLRGRHLDAKGYTITVTNEFGQLLSISNTCAYPVAWTYHLHSELCVNAAPRLLIGNPGDANIVSQGFKINGFPARTFNPATLGIGTHEVTYTVDGGQPKLAGPDDPGCVSAVSKFITVIAAPPSTKPLVALNSITINVASNCKYILEPGDILEGYYCWENNLVVERKSGSDWIPAVAGYQDINRNIVIRARDLISGNTSNEVRVAIRDAFPPRFITCADLTVSCALIPEYRPEQLAHLHGYPKAIPAVTDGCDTTRIGYPSTNFTYTDVWYDQQPCSTGSAGYLIRTWKATDRSNNTAMCKQKISFQSTPAPATVPLTASHLNETSRVDRSGEGFKLYQNSPNPFNDQTIIGFHLPEATKATLTIFNALGRAVYMQSGLFAKGYNQIVLDRAQTGAEGAILFYQLQTATDRASRQMIQIKQ